MANKKITLILASSSKARIELLERVGYKPKQIHHPNVDESVLYGESPKNYVIRLAELKAKTALNLYKNSYILGADTVIVSGNKIIGKAKNYDEAYKILSKLSGKKHRVFGGICLISPKKNIVTRAIVTRVSFKYISSHEIKEYLATNEWKDKAGSYAIQGYASRFIKHINGNYDNVVGLSLVHFYSVLKGLK